MLPTIKILVVDDEPLIRNAVRMLTEEYAHIAIVGEAENGQEAINQTKLISPDVILMDIDMPVMNGLKATQVLASDYKIIICSTHQDPDYIEAACLAGAWGYLPKDHLFHELLFAIESVANGHFYFPNSLV